MQLGYGSTTKRGLCLAGNAGHDLVQDALQYGGIQISCNWDCCGIAFEYRRLAVGVTNENEKYFSITLAGVGAAGNLRHPERIF
jgi:LPS-assembly protein